MSELNFGLKISTFKISININKAEEANKKALSSIVKNEARLLKATNAKVKNAAEFYLADCRY